MAMGGDLGASELVTPDPGPTPTPRRCPPSGAAQAEALSALQNLGYAPADAARAVAEVAGTAPEAQTPEMIRARPAPAGAEGMSVSPSGRVPMPGP
jgi:Holliday junction DNA helicase RuvA